MQLLERESALADLDAALAAARSGRGRVVLVSGGAGMGKTSVVRAFLAGLDARTRVLEGACDDLLTPRPLEIETECWRLRIGTPACHAVGIGHRTGCRWRAETVVLCPSGWTSR
jgi:hypothetical protein